MYFLKPISNTFSHLICGKFPNYHINIRNDVKQQIIEYKRSEWLLFIVVGVAVDTNIE